MLKVTFYIVILEASKTPGQPVEIGATTLKAFAWYIL